MHPILIGLITFIVVFAGYSYLNYRRIKHFSKLPDSEEISHLTDKNFNKETAKGIVLIDFWASWCMPCKMMAPVLNQVAENVHGQARVAKVNVEEFQNLAGKFQVRSIPTLLLLKDGKEVNRFVGVKSKDFLLKKIRNA
ncbi:thioredoxin [Geofilum rubicundum]|uniref:Thioredoxin n=1 Tax=Geofilum rubicundum JCM 15548 TaxID=1236989 RepID=A0A0E9M273_9BACT|nr:thioredoxin [Geofilum rubicundum]GAO31225.1 thioredoxin [Geofilum rubicundum JCM 15548]